MPIKLLDLLGRSVRKGDKVVYGKSDRHNPLAIGKVLEITDEYVKVMGESNVREGKIPMSHAKNRIVRID